MHVLAELNKSGRTVRNEYSGSKVNVSIAAVCNFEYKRREFGSVRRLAIDNILSLVSCRIESKAVSHRTHRQIIQEDLIFYAAA